MGLALCEVTMQFEVVIGLELHIQLATKSKLFSSSPNHFGSAVNQNVNEIDLAYPGALPVLNEQAVVFAALFGYAIEAHVNSNAVFMRKNYFYPDLPKGYQLSQLDDAIIQGGVISLDMGGYTREVRINRGQLEEDAGKSVHDAFPDSTGIDLNRAGVPLIELVTEPDMRSAKEAVAFMRQIHQLVRYLGISDGNMQEGSFRCDANVSLREIGSTKFNERVELKNINSFRFVEQAINIEIERQTDVVLAGEKVVQETRLFDPDMQQTRTMRTKEEANDYRYFPDPDLLPLSLGVDWLADIQASLPELPQQRKIRLATEFALDEDSIAYLMQSKAIGDYFDATVNQVGDARLVSNWIQGDLARLLNEHNTEIENSLVSTKHLAQLLCRLKDNTISNVIAKKLLPQMWLEGKSADDLIEAQGLKQIDDDGQLEEWIDEVLAVSTEQVKAYQAGQDKMLGYFVGQVLKKSKGKANPKAVNEALRKKLSP